MAEVKVYALTPGGDPVEGTYVALHDNATKAVLQTDFTDASGIASFPGVAAATYEIRVAPGGHGVVTSGKVQTIVVADAGNDNFDVEITPASLPTSNNTQMCRISGFIVDSVGLKVGKVPIHIGEACVPQIEIVSGESTLISPHGRVVQSDSDGYFSFDLYRNAEYTLLIPGWINEARVVLVPDQAAVNLADLIFPFVSLVEWYDDGIQIVPATAPTLAVAIDATKVIDYSVIFRNGNEAYDDEAVFKSADEDVFTISGSSSAGALTITGVGAGTALVKITRAKGSPGVMVTTAPDIIGELSVTVA